MPAAINIIFFSHKCYGSGLILR